VFRRVSIAGFATLLFCTTVVRAGQTQSSDSQQTQPGQPVQPSSSIYNRMRRIPPSQTDQAQPSTQTQQFPSPAQQFPPEQQGPPTPGQRPPMRFPHPTLPEQATTPAVAPPASQPAKPAPQQEPQTAYGLALKPANPPRISFAGKELTVTADNSSLADILRGIGRVTGARVEGAQSDSERVFGQFGPGTPREVLNSLLGGSRYDFILVGSMEDPGTVQRVLLSSHGAVPAAGAIAANQPARPASEDEDNDSFVTPQVEQPAPPQPAVSNEQPQVQQQTGQPQQQVKTPEQLLQELQRLRQQQQQQTNSPR